MSKLFYFIAIFGVGALLHNLKTRVDSLENENTELKKNMEAESQASMDYECEMEGELGSAINTVAIEAGRAIGDLDTELRTLQLDFYKFLSMYKHWDENQCKFTSLAPYINETLTPEGLKSLEACLRDRGLRFTVNENY